MRGDARSRQQATRQAAGSAGRNVSCDEREHTERLCCGGVAPGTERPLVYKMFTLHVDTAAFAHAMRNGNNNDRGGGSQRFIEQRVPNTRQ